MSGGKERILHDEREFHDDWAAGIDVNEIDVVRFFEGSTSPENRFITRHVGDVAGKRVLELGCGAGEASVYFALHGAKCVATDYSPGMVETALRLAERYGVTIEARTMDAEVIDFPDGHFDIVYAANVLHHVDVKGTLAEIHRVLTPGGRLCFWDPLKHNPVINVYRRMAWHVRTEDEHPLSIHDVKILREVFQSVEYDTFWFATLWIFLRFYLFERIDPNEERYWKKIVSEEPRLRSTFLALEPIDTIIKRIPFMNRFGWNICGVATK